jgi:hypothetical protein
MVWGCVFVTFALPALRCTGVISREELVKLFHTFVKGVDEKKLTEYINNSLAAMDKNTDHRVSFAEFERFSMDPLSGGASFSKALQGGFEAHLLRAFGVTQQHLKK